MAGVFEKPIEIAIEAQSRADGERLRLILEMLAAVDAFVGMAIDEQTGQTILKGPDEAYLVFVINQLRRDFGIAVNVGAPQIAYRETLGQRSEIDYTHKKLGGGSGQTPVGRRPDPRPRAYSHRPRRPSDARLG